MIKKSKYMLSPNKRPQKISAEKQSQPTVRLEKSFKKKDHHFQNRQISPEKNLVRTFRQQKQNQQIRQLSPQNYIRIEQKSPTLTKQVSKLSLKDDIYKKKQLTTSTSKLKLISDVLLRQIESQPYLIIQEVYERNSNFKQLLSEWQRKQLYDQTDKLIYRMNQFYTNLLEQVLQKSVYHLQKALNRYEETLVELQRENAKLKKSRQNYEKHEEYLQILNDRLNQYYEKSQWATVFLNSFNIFDMDFQAFIKQNLLRDKLQEQDTSLDEQLGKIDKIEGKHFKLIDKNQLLKAYANQKIKSQSNMLADEEQKFLMSNQRFSK